MYLYSDLWVGSESPMSKRIHEHLYLFLPEGPGRGRLVKAMVGR